MNETTTKPGALSIHGDYGTFILARNVTAARDFARAEGYELGRDVGWMHEVGWDTDEYESREEFEAQTGHTSWWTGCQPPASGKPSTGVMRAWEASAR